MTTKGYNNFNNLTFVSKQIAIGERLEQLAGHTPLDLSFKKPSPTIEILTSGVSKINGKYADLKYIPNVVRSRPNFNYDAGYDPTLINAVRNSYVDVSGSLIPNKDLPKNYNVNTSRNPLIPYGYIQ